MNNEPVGYYYAKACIDIRDCSEQMKRNGIPLYTHPAKTDKQALSHIALEEKSKELLSSDFGYSYIDGFEDGALWAEERMFNPAKTLTDEEIISSAEEAGFNWSKDKGIFVRHSNGSWIGLDSKMVDFARAILRKAQEK